MRRRAYTDFQYQNHSLRINVSELAACAGFHPYKCLPKLFLDHVYQGFDGQALLQHDAQLLGLRLVSEEDQWKDLAKKAGTETLHALQTALRVQRGEQKLESIQHAEALRTSVLQAARISNQLSTKELHVLQEGTRQSIHTGFGTAWEDEALDMYERQCGWPVEHRNSEVRVWDFGKDGRPLDQARTGRRCSPSIPILEDDADGSAPPSKRSKSQDVDDQSIDLIDLTGDSLIMKSTSKEGPFPFFSLRGAVDGIRDELITSTLVNKEQPVDQPRNEEVAVECDDADEDSWGFRQVIVECKHRMHQLQPTPPLYEMIQATTYCLMYQTEAADLLQVLRIEPPKIQSGRVTRNEQTDSVSTDTHSTGVLSESAPTHLVSAVQHDLQKSQESGSASSMKISVCRLTVDDPVFGHRQNWHAVVAPRLVEWTQGVYHVRSHDELRYRLLMALSTTEHMEEAWSVLYEKLDWLHDCDTSYRRDITTMGSSFK